MWYELPMECNIYLFVIISSSEMKYDEKFLYLFE